MQQLYSSVFLINIVNLLNIDIDSRYDVTYDISGDVWDDVW